MNQQIGCRRLRIAYQSSHCCQLSSSLAKSYCVIQTVNLGHLSQEGSVFEVSRYGQLSQEGLVFEVWRYGHLSEEGLVIE